MTKQSEVQVERMVRLGHRIMNKHLAARIKGKKYYMSFSFSRKLIWFRIAKCATRTIDELLSESGYVYGGLQNYFPSIYKNWLKFTFIRNPLDRFKSCYKERVSSNTPFISKYNKNRRKGSYFPEMSVNEFINFIDSQNINSPKTDEHIRSQVSMIDLDNIDFIGTLDNFERDIAKILEIKSIPRINKSKNLIITLTESQKNILETIYKKDFDLYHKYKE